jgi:hypothetical protein
MKLSALYTIEEAHLSRQGGQWFAQDDNGQGILYGRVQQDRIEITIVEPDLPPAEYKDAVQSLVSQYPLYSISFDAEAHPELYDIFSDLEGEGLVQETARGWRAVDGRTLHRQKVDRQLQNLPQYAASHGVGGYRRARWKRQGRQVQDALNYSAIPNALRIHKAEFGGKRWPQFEKFLLQRAGLNAFHRPLPALFSYMSQLKERWPEGEQYAEVLNRNSWVGEQVADIYQYCQNNNMPEMAATWMKLLQKIPAQGLGKKSMALLGDNRVAVAGQTYTHSQSQDKRCMYAHYGGLQGISVILGPDSQIEHIYPNSDFTPEQIEQIVYGLGMNKEAVHDWRRSVTEVRAALPEELANILTRHS